MAETPTECVKALLGWFSVAGSEQSFSSQDAELWKNAVLTLC
jgi:hypothetical protein